MATDPFADDAPWNDYDAENDISTDDNDTEENNNMADYVTPEQDGTEVSVTLKGGAGYDAPWVVLRGKDVDSVSAMLDEKLQNLLRQAAKYGQFFSQTTAPASRPSNGGGQQTQQAPVNRAPAAVTQHPEGKQEVCDHGEPMQYKAGVSQRTGKAYKMFVCTARVPREQQCRPKNA